MAGTNDSTDENVLRTGSRYKYRMTEKGDDHEFGSHGPHLGSPRAQDTNHGRGTAVQNTWLTPETSDPVPLGRARTRRCGKIPAPLRDPHGDLHSIWNPDPFLIPR